MNEELQSACRAVIDAQCAVQDIEVLMPPVGTPGSDVTFLRVGAVDRSVPVPVNDARRLLDRAMDLARHRLAEAKAVLRAELG